MDKQPNKLLKPKTPSSTSAKWNKSSTKAATTSNDNSSSDNFDINSILSRHRKEMEEQEPSQSVEFTTADVNILPPTQVISQLLKMQVVHQATIRFEKEVDAAMERYKKTVSQSTTTTTSSIESTLKEASSLADDQQMDEVTILFNSCTQGLREAAKDGDDSVGSALSNQETLDCLVVLLALYNAASPQDLPKSKLRQPAAELVSRLFADNAGALVDAVTRQLKTLSGQMYFGSMEHFDVFECFVFLPVCQLTHDRLLCSLSLLGSLFNLNPEKVKKEVVSATALEDLLLSLVTLNSLFSESAGMGCVRAKRIRQAIKDFARRHLFISLSGKTPNAGQTEQQQQQQCIQFKVLPSGNSRHLTTLLTAFLRLIHFLKKHICPFDNKKHLWRENEAIISDLWYWLANFLQRLEEDFISKSTAELAIKKLGRPFSTASHSSASSLSSLSDWSDDDDDDDFDGPFTSALKKRTPTKRPEKKYLKISTDQFPEKNDRFCAPLPPITVGEASKKRENISSSSSSQSRDTIGADCGTGSPFLQWEEVEGDNGDDDKSSQKHELCRLLYLHFEDSFGHPLIVEKERSAFRKRMLLQKLINDSMMRLLRLLVNELGVETVAGHVKLYQIEEKEKYGQSYKRGRVAVISRYLEELEEELQSSKETSGAKVEGKSVAVTSDSKNKLLFTGIKAILSEMSARMTKQELLIADLLKKLDGNNSGSSSK